MLFTHVCIHATLLTMSHTTLLLILTIPDKPAGYNGGKPISKQTLIKAKNSGTTTKR